MTSGATSAMSWGSEVAATPEQREGAPGGEQAERGAGAGAERQLGATSGRPQVTGSRVAMTRRTA